MDTAARNLALLGWHKGNSILAVYTGADLNHWGRDVQTKQVILVFDPKAIFTIPCTPKLGGGVPGKSSRTCWKGILDNRSAQASSPPCLAPRRRKSTPPCPSPLALLRWGLGGLASTLPRTTPPPVVNSLPLTTPPQVDPRPPRRRRSSRLAVGPPPLVG
jgi:hypothetical protein